MGRQSVIDLPIFSPIELVSDPLFERKGIEVMIKRDDLIHPYISGNKWRKLKYVLRDAESQGKRHLVTFGGAYSNHLLATACASAKFGFRSTGIVRGEEVENAHLKLCRLFGMNLIFSDRESYKNKLDLYNRFFGEEQDSYFIDEGGSGALAVKGCSELIAELDISYDHIFCAAGTGSTSAGIIKGCAAHALNTKVNVVPAIKGGASLAEEIRKYTSANFQIHDQYHFGGYARTTKELLEFMNHFISSTGILIDQVYNAKMLFAIYDLAAKDHFERGSKILAVHTGGLLGVLGMVR